MLFELDLNEECGDMIIEAEFVKCVAEEDGVEEVELIDNDNEDGDDVDEFEPHDLFSLFIRICCF